MLKAALILLSLSSVLSLKSEVSDCNLKIDFQENHDTYNFTLIEFPYPYSHTEPVITAQMNYIHHKKHQAKYISKLNDRIAAVPEYQGKTLLELLDVAKDDAVLQKHAGGVYNHNLYWWIMNNQNCNGEPSGDLRSSIEDTWGSFSNFTATYISTANTVFGSGWVWLVVKNSGDLAIVTSANQLNPLMGITVTGETQEKSFPILGMDLWEHAYYLKYMWDKDTFFEEWLKIIDWEVVEYFYDNYAIQGYAVPA
jgi:Fe-Mn family superoxide dismutase